MRSTWLHSPAIGAAGEVIRYGHWGRAVLVFPAERGRAHDFAANGMVDAAAPLIDAGRVMLYCVDAFDGASWSNGDVDARGARPAPQLVRVMDPGPGGALHCGRR